MLSISPLTELCIDTSDSLLDWLWPEEVGPKLSVNSCGLLCINSTICENEKYNLAIFHYIK